MEEGLHTGIGGVNDFVVFGNSCGLRYAGFCDFGGNGPGLVVGFVFCVLAKGCFFLRGHNRIVVGAGFRVDGDFAVDGMAEKAFNNGDFVGFDLPCVVENFANSWGLQT